MDSEDTKQVIVAYYAIKNAIKTILKPIRTELGDSETVAKMPRGTYDALAWFKADCKSIQATLSRMESCIDDLQESIFDDGTDLEAVAKSILGIKQ